MVGYVDFLSDQIRVLTEALGEKRILPPDRNSKPQLGISSVFFTPQVCPTCTLQNEPNRPGCEACTTERPKEYKIPPPGPLDTIPRGATTATAAPQVKQTEAAAKPLAAAGTLTKEVKAPGTVTKEKV